MAKTSTQDQVNHLAQMMLQLRLRCAVAESCTGGLVAAALTRLPGSAQWFDCGLVTYSNLAKHQLLGVSQDTLREFGAVSQETVIAMATGVLQRTSVQLGFAVTGIAGPDKDNSDQPVGTVWFAWALRNRPLKTTLHHLQGDRDDIRNHCVTIAIAGMIDQIQSLL